MFTFRLRPDLAAAVPMRFRCRQRWLLRRMNRSLCRSDPHLAAMLAMFARLNADEAITSKEQAASSIARAWRGLAWLGRAITCMVAGLIACAGWVFRRVTGLCAAVRPRLSRAVRAALGISSPVHPRLPGGGAGVTAG